MRSFLRNASVGALFIFLFCNFGHSFAQGCRQVCDNAFPNDFGFECPAGLGGTWEPLDPLYQCENNSTLGCDTIDVTNSGVNTSIWSINCQCADGWTGQTCGMCTTNDACTTNGTLIECNRTPSPYKRKVLECYPQEELVKQLFGEGTISYIFDVDAAQAEIYLWKRTKGQPYNINCTMIDCAATSDEQDNVIFGCGSIECTCNPDPLLVNCSEPILLFITENLRGESTFSCENKENPICTLNQVDIPVQVSLSCSAAECGRPTGLVVPEADKVTGIVLGAFILPIGIAALVILPFVIYILDNKRERPADSSISAAAKGSQIELINVEYKVNIRSGNSCKRDVEKKTVLKNVNMKVLPGQVCAVMGSSGAGKTTLLDIMSDVGKRGVVSGQVLLDGKTLPKHFKRITGYVTQEECLIGTLTVTEQLIYSAQLRLPSSVPYSQVKQIVSNVINDLRLNHVASTLIGDNSVRGLSGGERRRVSIATELVTYPRILLLDEPTSGLDSYNATVVMQLLQDLAQKRNCSIICSIHQPRRLIYQMFDVLVLLWNGNVVYHGPGKEAIPFFASHGFKCPKYENPADYLLSVLNEESDEQLSKLTAAYEETRVTPGEISTSNVTAEKKESSSSDSSSEGDSSDKETLVVVEKDETEQPPKEENAQERNNKARNDSEDKYSSSWAKQFLVLAHRSAIKMWRNPALLRTHAIITIVVAVFIGVIFLNLANDVAGFQNRLGMIFFSLILFGFGCLSAIDLFIADRVMFKKERANGCYYTSSYYLSTMLSDLMPLRIIFPLIYGVVVYWMAGFVGDPDHFLKFILVFLLFNMVAASMFYVISIAVPSVTVGSIVSAAILLFLMLFSGLLVNNDSMPVWLVWLRYLSFFSYAFESIAANELNGLNLSLSVEGFGSVDISANVFLVAFSLDVNNYWRNVGILAGMFVVLNILAYILLRYVRKPKQ